MVLGAKLFHDYSGKYPFDQKMGGLVKELRQLKTSSVSKDVADAPAIVAEQVFILFCFEGRKEMFYLMTHLIHFIYRYPQCLCQYVGCGT